jgi:CRISPR/Cas system CSM-associated protein Csm5 (group 7 of RAMP superfamily)
MIKDILSKGSKVLDTKENIDELDSIKSSLQEIFENISTSNKFRQQLRKNASEEMMKISNNIGKAQSIREFIEKNENELDEQTKEKLWKEYINIFSQEQKLLEDKS